MNAEIEPPNRLSLGSPGQEDSECEETDTTLWRLRVGDRSAAMPIAQGLVQRSLNGGKAFAVGLFHRAWCHLALGDESACAADLSAASAIFERLGDRARLADCMDLRAQLAWIAGDGLAAIGFLEEAQELVGDERSALSGYLSLNLRGLCEWDQGQWDAALRSLTRAIFLAEQADSAQCLSNALANCGGFHADMFNFEVSKRLAARARDVAQGHPGSTVWWTAGINAMLAHDALGEAELAWSVGLELLAKESDMPARKRVSYYSKLGFVAVHAGQPDAARTCVEKALQHGDAQAPITDLVWAQVELHLAKQQHSQARALAEARLQCAQRGQWADTPLDVWRMLRSLVTACKGMNDFEAALSFEEQASEKYAELVGRSARANRVMIEVELETQRTAWQRDQALRLHREELLEKHRLAELNAALTEANRAKERLLAIASHDLRQPLHALGMYLASLHADLRARGELAEQLALVKRAEETADALVTMFGTLLDLSKLDNGIVQVNMQALDLGALCQRLVRETGARSTAVVRFLQVRPDVKKFGRTDAGLLERCLRNLVENALRYAAGKPLCLAIRQRASHWRIEVRDGGGGIAPEHIDAVFEEFFRVEKGYSDTPGLGLGLPIVKRLCHLMDHPLKLRSVLGEGTVVCVCVPKCPAPSQSSRSAAPKKPRKALHLAVVDDDASVRESATGLLTRWGYTVEASASGQSWLADDVMQRPDAFIVDYHLGEGSDGVELIDRLRSRWGDTDLPCLIVTAETSASALGRIQVNGIAHLAKPIQPSRLRAWLTAVESAGKSAPEESAP